MNLVSVRCLVVYLVFLSFRHIRSLVYLASCALGLRHASTYMPTSIDRLRPSLEPKVAVTAIQFMLLFDFRDGSHLVLSTTDIFMN